MQNVFATSAPGERHSKVERLLFFDADIHRRKPLTPQFAGDPLLCFAMHHAGAKLAIGCDGSEVVVRCHDV
jgi:hypothetical protein